MPSGLTANARLCGCVTLFPDRMVALSDAISRVASIGRAPATRRSAESMLATYSRFCSELQLNPSGVYTAERARLFCGWWNIVNKKGATMNTSWLNYHYAVAAASRLRHGGATRLSLLQMADIKATNRAFMFCNKRPFRRVAPLTRDLLRRLAGVLDEAVPDDLQLKAAAAFAFVGFLRMSEFLGSDSADYAPRYRDLVLYPSSLVYFLDKWKWSGPRASAVISYPRGCVPFLDAAGLLDRLCWVTRSMSLRDCMRCLPRERVFVRLVAGVPMQQALSRHRYTARLRASLAHAGVANVEMYAPGSFRRGAVTDGLAAQMDRQVMRAHLRWSDGTDLFNTYGEATGSMRQRALGRLGGGVPQLE